MAKTLGSRRFYIQRETRKIVDRLDRLLRENRAQLEPLPTTEAAREFIVFLRKRLDASEKLHRTLPLDPDLGYLESVEMHTRAVRACERIAGRVSRAKEHLANKVSEPRREAHDADDRPLEERHIAALLSKAHSFYQRGELDRALSVVDGVRDLDPHHAGANTLYSRVTAHLEEQRLEEGRARQAAELFQTAAAKFEKADLAACLPLLSEIFRLQPDHLAATALQEKVHQQIKEAADRSLRKGDESGKRRPPPPK
jgi:tetratricopeptide (TPR) repeat protein